MVSTNALGNKAVNFHFLHRNKDEIPTFEDLGITKILADLSMMKRGLVIVVGATGTGKSSTLASMVGYRNKNSH